MQEILKYMRKAIEDFDMIKDGDKIALGLSGGKDSTTLLLALDRFRKFFPKKFEFIAVTIDPGFEEFSTEYLEQKCKELNIEYIVYKSQIKEIVFDIRNEKNPCSLCANLRRGMLNSVAKEHGCNKIMLAHHMEDALETFLLNVLYTGNISTFAPVTYLDKMDLYTIRPLIYTPEKYIKIFIKNNNIPVMPKCCSMDGASKREDMKGLINSLSKNIPHIKANMFGAIQRSKIKGWEKIAN